MTTRYIPLSAEIGTAMTTSVTTMQIIIETNKLCKREHGESNALDSWKLNIFKIIDDRI